MISILLRIKKFIIKLLTCLIIDKSLRKNTRNLLYYFSIKDYKKFKNQQFTIVSLGANCLPRVLFTATKIKPRKIYGEKTMPFDLCLCYNFDIQIDFIEKDFVSFFEDLSFNKKFNCWQNKKADILFIHDKNPNKENFIERYKNRIKNFQNIFQSSKKPIFVYYVENRENKTITKEQFEKLYKILEHKRGSKDFELVILNNQYLNFSQKNITQICEPFKIDDLKWAEYMINEYQNYNNKYTNYAKLVTEQMISTILP